MLDKRLAPTYMNKFLFIKENLGEGIGKNLLDVGCGDGGFFGLYAEKGFNFFGIEPELGRPYHDTRKRDKRVLNAVAESLPFKANYFDTVVCVDSLEHVQNIDKTLEEIQRVLKPEGRLILTIPDANYPWVYDPVNFVLRHFNKHISIGIWGWGHKRLLSLSQMNEILLKHNFKVMKYEGRSHWINCMCINYTTWLYCDVIAPLLKRHMIVNNTKPLKGKLYTISEFIRKKDFNIDGKSASICMVCKKESKCATTA